MFYFAPRTILPCLSNALCSQTSSRKLADSAKKVGLEINVSKTEYMTFNIDSSAQQPLLVYNQPLKRVDDFKYLGSMMASSANGLKSRTAQAWKAYWKLIKIWRGNLSLKLKLQIYNAAVISILLYGSETWVINAKMETSLNTFHTKCLRYILNISLLDHITFSREQTPAR